ncbi:MAG TPA: sialate O-acetylesterase [Puia sp.]|nr:sialate O-acetylesterase [Puia sp.]
MNSKKRGWWLFWLVLSGPACFAQIRVPRLVSNGMVLQRDMPLRIWGFGTPGGKVTVKFAGESASGVTDDNGKWEVELGPKKAGGPYTMDIDGINHIWIKDIMVGEVWFCSGQYNMQLPMEKVREQYADVIAHADNLPIRQFRITEHYDYKTPRTNVSSGRWETVSPGTVLSFSALGYLFAKRIYEQYHCAVGLIDACVGDAPAEAWLSPDALQMLPEYASAATRYADSTYPEGTGPADRMAPGGLFNGMIAPADTYTVRGILWWQGEANVPKAGEYAALFPALINDWRQHWSEPALPFLYVQLEAHGPVSTAPGESQWAELREAQRMALKLPGTGMTVTADLDEDGSLKPQDLDEIARRLMLSAEAIAIGKKNIIFTGPLFETMKAHGDKIHIMFAEANTGLIVKGGGELKGFAIAGMDNKFFPAHAETDGKKVIVWSEQVAQPVEVRYGWADNPWGMNLSNRDILFKDGLPAPPFAGRVRARKK